MLRTALAAGKCLHAVLCAIGRIRTVPLSIAVTILSLLVILVLLEHNYREEVAREQVSDVTFTGSIASAPSADLPKIEFGPKRAGWTPLAPPFARLAPPSVAAQPTGSTHPTSASRPPPNR
jgi:hypothetical protein